MMILCQEGLINNSEFKMYYDIRKPIFDYFQRLVFMPVKHCIYKEQSSSGQAQFKAIALENILAELQGNYITYPENSRERFINCKSPVVKTWIEKRGKLITEVGFFGNDMKYFLRPEVSLDSDDEASALQIWPHITKGKNLLLDIIMEPDFGNSYYKEVQNYILQGSNLNPYINEEQINDPDVPRHIDNGQIDFKRFFTYKIDELSSFKWFSMTAGTGGIFMKRLSILESAVKTMEGRTTNKEFELQFGWELRSLIDIGFTAESIENKADYPFFTKAYQDYHNQQTINYMDLVSTVADSFASFIKNHPESLYSSINSSFVIVPYADKSKNFPARVFQRFNEFAECIELQKKWGLPCQNIEEKTIFVEMVLKYYYEQVLVLKEEDEKNKKGNKEVAPH